MLVKKNIRILGAERQALAANLHQRYVAGESIRNLALSINRSYGFVHQLLEETDTDFRARGGNSRTTSAA